jgi:hypothetical protein
MDLQNVILGIVGAVLSLAFSYVPALKAWFDARPNKGLLMLGFVVLVGLAYFGLSCTPLAAQLNITLSCSQAGALQLAQAIFALAAGNQLAYLFSNNSPAAPPVAKG